MGNKPAGSTIAVCGHLCLDIIPGFPAGKTGHDYFRPGRLSVIDAPTLATGGAVSNVGIGLHRLGLRARLVAKIGDDPLGRLIRERVGTMGAELGAGIVSVPGETTSYTVVLNPPGIDRIFLHCPGANDTFTEKDVKDSVFEDAGLFHFGYPPLLKGIFSDCGAGLSRIMARARAHGALTSLDMSLPDPASESGRVDWPQFLTRVLPAVDFFVPSIEELAFMTDRRLFDELAASGGGEAIIRRTSFAQIAGLADAALSRGAGVVLIKLGDRGVYLRTGDGVPGGLEGWKGRELYSPVFTVERVWTTGSGDATISGFLASAFKGLTAEEALTMAVAVGGCCVEAPDATSGVRTWAETQGRVKGGWAKAAVRVTEAGWREGSGGVWHGPRDRAS
jgi:sugar/nucleoside kinase (ribokinase family)